MMLKITEFNTRDAKLLNTPKRSILCTI